MIVDFSHSSDAGTDAPLQPAEDVRDPLGRQNKDDEDLVA